MQIESFFLPFIIVVVTLLSMLNYGGLATIQHYCLRFLLGTSRILPFNLVSFLDEMTAFILIQRVGGGWVFIHRSLLEYFAAHDADGRSSTPMTEAA